MCTCVNGGGNGNKNKTDKGSYMHGHNHEQSLLKELVYHLPYAVFAVAFSLAVLSFFSFSSHGCDSLHSRAGILFHSFHFMHILFSVTGTLITYYRFSKGLLRGFFVGIFSAMVFCTLSDALLPYIAGRLLGVDMCFHLCFLQELHNIVPFLVIGLANGIIIGYFHKSNEVFYSVFSHFLHILVSSFASMFYLVAHGFEDWYSQIGMVSIFLLVAVVVPCIFSDIITPMTFAKVEKKNERNKVT